MEHFSKTFASPQIDEILQDIFQEPSPNFLRAEFYESDFVQDLSEIDLNSNVTRKQPEVGKILEAKEEIEDLRFFGSDLGQACLFEYIPEKAFDEISRVAQSPDSTNKDATTAGSALLKSTRATRKDVYRRKMLRSIKKFFYGLFKFHNDKLFNKRLVNLQSSTILEALQKFARAYMSQSDPAEMAQFMFKAMNLNSLDSVKMDSEALKCGGSTYECMQNYNDKKYDELFTSQNFKELIISFVSLRNLSQETLKEMKESEQWEHQFNFDQSRFAEINTKYLYKEMGEVIEARLAEAYSR